ncbi:hypothetical protein [Actinomadura rubrisoli]|uniref:Secreted protein n=1 Tax=Actinomadura rubrisoli TaxID=2530368 RepID=A0A4R5AYR3_9ACTN|nr:hypothetical protein [Actinomadura rubrisoli]TDD77795.1 hypothetical protein E1298_29455 [Actinomadura rubrisoli]
MMILKQSATIRVLRPDVLTLVVAAPLTVLVAGLPGGVHDVVRLEPAKAGNVAAVQGLGDFDMRGASTPRAPIRALGRSLTKSGVGALIRSPGQRRLGGGCGKAAGVPAQSAVYCWDKEDFTTRTWVPQGVTSVSDAAADESFDGRPMLVSWYAATGIRVTFVNPDRRTYRHVLLVYPTMKGRQATYGDIGVHAGGIAWFGNKLYVADTRAGLREFDMGQIYDLGQSKAGSTENPGWVGRHGDKYYAHGYRYVMPQTGSWQYVQGKAPLNRCRGAGPLRTSWTSIDRTGWQQPVLIAGEYCAAARPRGRVVTWPLRVGTGLGGPGDIARATWAATLPDRKIQGGVRTHGYWWFSRNRDDGSRERRGELLLTARDWWGWDDVVRRPASYGPEDLSCFRGQRRIWTVGEHAGKRALWGTPAPPCGY